MPNRFRKKPIEVEAVQWTGENREPVAALLGLHPNDLHIDQGTILAGNVAIARLDYLLIHTDGERESIGWRKFEATYEPTPKEPETSASLTGHNVPGRLRALANVLEAGGRPEESTPALLRGAADELSQRALASAGEGEKRGELDAAFGRERALLSEVLRLWAALEPLRELLPDEPIEPDAATDLKAGIYGWEIEALRAALPPAEFVDGRAARGLSASYRESDADLAASQPASPSPVEAEILNHNEVDALLNATYPDHGERVKSLVERMDRAAIDIEGKSLELVLRATPAASTVEGDGAVPEDARLAAFEALLEARIWRSVDEHQEEHVWRIVDICANAFAASTQPVLDVELLKGDVSIRVCELLERAGGESAPEKFWGAAAKHEENAWFKGRDDTLSLVREEVDGYIGKAFEESPALSDLKGSTASEGGDHRG